MRIEQLAVKNYRTLEKIDVNFSTDYCTISGHNNAGKSSIIRLLRLLLQNQSPIAPDIVTLDHSSDRTQWADESASISVDYVLCLNRTDDTSLINFIGKFSNSGVKADIIKCHISISIDAKERRSQALKIENEKFSEENTREILTKLRQSNSMFPHNSTLITREFWQFRSGRLSAAYPIMLSSEENREIQAAEQAVQRKIKKLTKTHKAELESMIGKLKDKYGVEFSLIDSYASRKMPFDINLKDRSAEVPLDDWGSGTQNRTHILMSVLQAKRLKSGAGSDRETPIVVIEEPESFLHPMAQAEFGALLQALSKEVQIQIVASTHSPYMLNQESPSSNILLRRKQKHNKLLGSEIADTEHAEWMTPFAEHLGVIPPEFDRWRHVFAKSRSMMLLVESVTDCEYLEFIRKNYPEKQGLPPDVEIVSYDGKDALKSPALVKFALSKCSRSFITFDLDAADDVKKRLQTTGFVEGTDFCAVGVDKPGREAIEGLLPERILNAVNGRETDAVLSLTAKDSAARKSAKSLLKRKYLEELKKATDLSDLELEPLFRLTRQIGKNFS